MRRPVYNTVEWGRGLHYRYFRRISAIDRATFHVTLCTTFILSYCTLLVTASRRKLTALSVFVHTKKKNVSRSSKPSSRRLQNAHCNAAKLRIYLIEHLRRFIIPQIVSLRTQELQPYSLPFSFSIRSKFLFCNIFVLITYILLKIHN